MGIDTDFEIAFVTHFKLLVFSTYVFLFVRQFASLI